MRKSLLAMLLALSFSTFAAQGSELQSTVQRRTQQYDRQPAKGAEEQAQQNKEASKLLSPVPGQSISQVQNTKPEENRADEHKWYDTLFEHPTEWLLALFNGLLVVYTYRLWTATRELAEGAERTAKAQLRAYVAAVPGTLESIVTGESVAANLKIINMGQTPVHNMRHMSSVQVLVYPLDEPLKFPCREDALKEDRLVSFGKEVLLKKTSLRPITAVEVAEITGSARLRIYCAGSIFYDDIFEEHRQTTFAFMYYGPNSRTMTGEYCEQGNKQT